ncbi:hypothetical protein VaNZ11_012702 [Volvox africanus]|uniref:TrmE-type G domain-containing protein n=1 Tax=Volvox africanus TaxID=51714 RepID=A0ABQ5SG08_9CHLO|nr:hypothetical protein VaNZ11_012702 [Volvox africanus]
MATGIHRIKVSPVTSAAGWRSLGSRSPGTNSNASAIDAAGSGGRAAITNSTSHVWDRALARDASTLNYSCVVSYAFRCPQSGPDMHAWNPPPPAPNSLMPFLATMASKANALSRSQAAAYSATRPRAMRHQQQQRLPQSHLLTAPPCQAADFGGALSVVHPYMAAQVLQPRHGRMRPRSLLVNAAAGGSTIAGSEANPMAMGGGDTPTEDDDDSGLGSGSVDGMGISMDGVNRSGSSARCHTDVGLTTKDEDTIASIVTGVSHGSVAIIRVSGTEAVSIASRVFRPGGRFRFGWQPKSHRVYYGTAVDGDEHLLDEVLLIVMLSPRSYTAEDVVEFHCHGGGVCASRVLRSLIEAGARPAKPGEFTLRAFLNGRLDLAQAEAISELIGARTAAAADSALAGLRGGVGTAVTDLRSRCLDVLAELEARLDFDEDLPSIDVPELKRRIEGIQAGIEKALRTARAGNLLRTGLQVAIVGRPNVGKSSLLNAWTNSDRAIVTEIAGTTRDVLEATLSVGGVPVTLLDTAGIRQSSDVVERIGVERSQAAAVAADIVIMVVDGATGWTDTDNDIFRALWGDGPGSSTCKVKGLALLVANKDDLRAPRPDNGAGSTTVDFGSNSAAISVGASTAHIHGAGSGAFAKEPPLPLPLLARETFAAVVRTSASERRGLEALDAALLKLVGAPQLASGGMSWSVNERQAEALVRSHEALMRLAESIAADMPLDFWTIDLRAALLALAEVSGDEVAEEVLDIVFSRFCIGK